MQNPVIVNDNETPSAVELEVDRKEGWVALSYSSFFKSISNSASSSLKCKFAKVVARHCITSRNEGYSAVFLYRGCS